MKSLKEDYGKLKNKYKGLPSYEDLDKEFELLYIGKVQEVNFPLRFIRRRILDKLISYSNMLQGMLQPNPGSLVNLQESKFFQPADKDKMVVLLKELMWFARQSYFLDTESDEKEDAKFIEDSFKKWKDMKKQVSSHIKTLRDGWKKEIKKDKGNNYVG